MVEDDEVICPVCGLMIKKHSDEEAEIHYQIINGWMQDDVVPKEPTETTTE